MDIKSDNKVTINLTEKEKSAINLTGEIIKKIDDIVNTHTEYTFEEFFEDIYNNNIVDFLYTLERKPNTIAEDINDLKEED